MSYYSYEDDDDIGFAIGTAVGGSIVLGACLGLSLWLLTKSPEDDSNDCSPRYEYSQEIGNISCQTVAVETSQD